MKTKLFGPGAVCPNYAYGDILDPTPVDKVRNKDDISPALAKAKELLDKEVRLGHIPEYPTEPSVRCYILSDGKNELVVKKKATVNNILKQLGEYREVIKLYQQITKSKREEIKL